MKFPFRQVVRLFLFITCLSLIILSCKDDPGKEPPKPIEEEEEVIPGQTVGYGATLLDAAEYEKIRLIQEPQIPNGRTLKDPQLPAQYDLAPTMPPVQSQGAQGSCTAWAVAYAARSYFNGMGKNNPFKSADGSVNNDVVLSPAFVYNQTKIGACGEGSYTSRVLEFVKTKGVCTWNEMPYNAADCNTMPNAAQEASAAKYRIKDWGRIKIEVPVVKKFLYYDMPVLISAKLNTDFKRSTKGPDGEFVWKDGSDTDVSYHAMIIVGYDDARKAFKIQNSWGTNWANKGYIWMNYDILTRVIREAYIMVPGEWPAGVETVKVATNEAGTVTEGQIELKGTINDLGSVAIIRYGICVSNTSTSPVDQIEVVNNPIKSQTHAFSVKAAAVGPKLYYRAFAETLLGIAYGDTKSVDVQNVGNPELKEALLFADLSSVFDPATGNKVAELPYNFGGSSGLTQYHRGYTLTKTNIFLIDGKSSNQSVMSYGIVDHKLKWSYQTGSSTYGYVVADEKLVYLTINTAIIALNRETGAKVWEYPTPRNYGGQPTVVNGVVYFGEINKGITAVNAETGKLIREYPGYSGRNAATVVNGVLYFIISTGVIAYDTSSGQKLWVFDGGSDFLNMTDRGSKVIHSDGKLFVTGFHTEGLVTKARVIALDPATGKIIWEQPLEATIWQANLNVDSGTLAYIVGSSDRLTVKLNVLDAATGKQRWQKVISGTGLYATDYNVLVVGTSVFLSGFENMEVLRALDSRNGNVMWVKKYEDARSPISPSLITASGKVYGICTMGIN